jgi:branched-chain amino acid transport system substrate-binding protein
MRIQSLSSRPARALAVFAGCALLASCGGAAAPPSSAAPSAPASAAKPAGSAAGSPAAAVSQPAATGAIKIGVLLPLTGGLAPLGKDNQDGLNLYLNSIKSTMAGRQIQISYADDQGQPDVGLTKAKGLVESEGVKMLMGITATPVAYAVATYVKDAHVPLMISENGGAQALVTDPKFKSPYLTRFTQSQTVIMDPPADWAYKHGWRKAIIMASDYGAGHENMDAFASTFVRQGGSIVQEQYAPMGTTDFGPYFAKLAQGADFVGAFFPGVDGVRFIEQIWNYASRAKLPVMDLSGGMTGGFVLADEKDAAVGVIADQPWSMAADNPANAAFLKAWDAKYPGRYPSADAAMGWGSGQILQAALEKVNGGIENTDAFLQALYATDMTIPKGPVKLDSNHDVVENIYIYQIEKQGDRYGQKLLDTYTGVSSAWDRSPEEVSTFPFGKLSGQWVGMTKEKLQAILASPAPAKSG